MNSVVHGRDLGKLSFFLIYFLNEPLSEIVYFQVTNQISIDPRLTG